ncbi:hypothetical protein WS0782 [Wolinella succinogenes]|uniref:Uncharacterized protein n=1 Tax=Wolinella succinogenes (strain ATCC 29543 / DSM 1740 / CCUG 13145 / JCM 31913 / LMG 7466 / NCTC 11488 / FDC 602W) TaxID=273121 RepID=Q7MS44_WOLSU|nr:hypothetical protein WS0782 [Wolinella succinogenes]
MLQASHLFLKNYRLEERVAQFCAYIHSFCPDKALCLYDSLSLHPELSSARVALGEGRIL